MAPNPIIFALANPDPEIAYDVALAARPDAIVATGRSDFPNQVNNVLGFPFIFRGALDVRATTINDEMKLAATRALAALAKEDVPDSVLRAYGVERLEFGREYIIPKPFDPRVLIWEASAVAQAAMETGVAQQPVDLAQYREELERRLGTRQRSDARHDPQSPAATPSASSSRKAKRPRSCAPARFCWTRKSPLPILLGNAGTHSRARPRSCACTWTASEIVDPDSSPRLANIPRSSTACASARASPAPKPRKWRSTTVTFGSLMVRMGDADALVGGLTTHYPDTIRPALQVIDVRPELRRVAGVYVLITPKGDIYFLADATVNIEPDGRGSGGNRHHGRGKGAPLQPGAARGHALVLQFRQHPPSACRQGPAAVDLVRQRAPGLMIDGEMQADTAVVPQIIEETYPFSTLKGGANVLVFPNLESGNIAYKLLQRIGGAELIGPLLTGLTKPVHVLQRGSRSERHRARGRHGGGGRAGSRQALPHAGGFHGLIAPSVTAPESSSVLHMCGRGGRIVNIAYCREGS